MDKIKVKKIAIISVSSLLLIIGIGFSGYKYTRVTQYNSLVEDANKYMESNEYDKAIALFQQSLNYKEDANVENSIKLAETLTEVKKVYDEGIKMMNDKKYLEAIEQFKKIGRESANLYNDAQSKINECSKEYISIRIGDASTALEAKQYEDANKITDEVLKLDNNNSDAKNLKDLISKGIEEQKVAQREKEEQEKVAQKLKEEQEKAARRITPESAAEIVRKLVLKNDNTSTICEFDHNQVENGVKYFVIHVYDIVVDHTATRGWYYVNPENGKVFDGTLGDLRPVN